MDGWMDSDIYILSEIENRNSNWKRRSGRGRRGKIIWRLW
jgi:hypothetical protein